MDNRDEIELGVSPSGILYLRCLEACLIRSANNLVIESTMALRRLGREADCDETERWVGFSCPCTFDLRRFASVPSFSVTVSLRRFSPTGDWG